jgi:beta-glucosidase-like glycosyl hydrolase
LKELKGNRIVLISREDDRTMHELYIWPFAEAVRAGVGACMTAYNAVSGAKPLRVNDLFLTIA